VLRNQEDSVIAGSESSRLCPICSGERREVFQAVLLKKYQVRYFFCGSCGLLQTEEPFWLDEAYSSAIADADTGLVWRNLDIARKLAGLLYFCFDPGASYLEFAGGYGLLTRLMRDRGFDFRWHDPYCKNIFARGFEWDQSTGNASARAVTAFEVLEHIPKPVDFIRGALAHARTSTIIFTTLLYNGEPPHPDKWWYYSLESGQHISFFRQSTLTILAQKLGLRLVSDGWFHILTNENIHNITLRACTGRFAAVLDAYVKRKMNSRTFDDHREITSR
jgi:hypothetical protein